MSQSSADRNLMLGVLAVQMEFVTRDQLMDAMIVWTQNRNVGLDTIFRNQLLIDENTQRTLGDLVDQRCLGEGTTKVETMVDPFATVAPSPPTPTLAFVTDPFATTAPQGDRNEVQLQNAFSPASTASRFKILRPHNAGGLGTVSVARDEELGREVALKEIKEFYADHPESRRRFIVEAEITGCLEHPGIVPVYGLGQYADGRPYYAMRFIRGESLQDAVDRFHGNKELDHDPSRRLLELRMLLRRIVDVCNAMEYAHSRGVLHRDLKPDNVMLGKYGETLVVDWGLAKADDRIETVEENKPPSRFFSSSSSASTQMGECLGTPAYMSPEQASGRLDLIKPPSDVYSIGATLYTLLTGKPPFSSDALLRLLQRVRDGDFPRPRAIDTRIPRALEAICLRAMATCVEDRYPTALALGSDLERWLADESVSAYVEPLGNRIARWSRHHRALVTSVIACTVASFFILSLFIALLMAANSRERTARELADSERDRAENNLQAAKEAVSTMLTEVGRDELKQYPQMEETRSKLLQRARTFYDQFLLQKPKDAALRFEVAVALHNLAEVDRLVDDYDQAELRYTQSMNQFQQLADENPDKPIYRRQLALVQDDLGQLLRSRDSDRAKSYYDQAIELQSKLKAEGQTLELTQELARSFYNRGIVQAELGNRDSAKADVLSAIETLSSMIDVSGNSNTPVKQELARCYNNLGNLLQSSGNTQEAITQFVRSLELLNELPDNRDRQMEQAIYQNNLANLHRSMKDLELADKVSESAIEKLTMLAQPLPLVANELANAHHNRGVILSERKLTEEAESEYDRAIGIWNRLVLEYPDVSLYHDRLGNSLFQMGSMQFQAKQYSTASKNIELAMVEHRLALNQSSAEPSYYQHLKNDLVGLALIYHSQGNHALAFDTALAIKVDLAKDGNALFDAAQLIARCIHALQQESAVDSSDANEIAKKRYETQFLETLNQAAVAGFQDSAKVEKAMGEMGAFFPLRSTPELQDGINEFVHKIIKSLSEKQP